MTDPSPIAPARPSAKRPVSRRHGPWPVLSAALAMFLVVLALMSARVVVGADPGLRTATQARVLTKSGHTVLRTTPSGRVVREAAAPTQHPGRQPAGDASKWRALVRTMADLTAPGVRRTGGPDRISVALLAAAGFLAVLALLGSQIGRAGADKARRPVIVRRIYTTTVEERVIGRPRGRLFEQQL